MALARGTARRYAEAAFEIAERDTHALIASSL